MVAGWNLENSHVGLVVEKTREGWQYQLEGSRLTFYISLNLSGPPQLTRGVLNTPYGPGLLTRTSSTVHTPFHTVADLENAWSLGRCYSMQTCSSACHCCVPC
jgi:hypothetical protein